MPVTRRRRGGASILGRLVMLPVHIVVGIARWCALALRSPKHALGVLGAVILGVCVLDVMWHRIFGGAIGARARSASAAEAERIGARAHHVVTATAHIAVSRDIWIALGALGLLALVVVVLAHVSHSGRQARLAEAPIAEQREAEAGSAHRVASSAALVLGAVLGAVVTGLPWWAWDVRSGLALALAGAAYLYAALMSTADPRSGTPTWRVALRLATSPPQRVSGRLGEWATGIDVPDVDAVEGAMRRGESPAQLERRVGDGARADESTGWLAEHQRVPLLAVLGAGAVADVVCAWVRLPGGDAIWVIGMLALLAPAWGRARRLAEAERDWRVQLEHQVAIDKVHAISAFTDPRNPDQTGALVSFGRRAAGIVPKLGEQLRTEYGRTHVVQHDAREGWVRLRPAPALPGIVPMPVPRYRGLRMDDHEWAHLPLGVTRDRGEAIWDLRQDPHGGVFGRTGSGKTIALTVLMTQALLRGWSVSACEVPKRGNDYRALAPWLAGFGTTLEQVTEVIEAIYAEKERRVCVLADHGGAPDWTATSIPDDVRPHPLLVVIDEEYSLLAQDKGAGPEAKAANEMKLRIADLSGRLTREARFVGIHLVHGMQQPYAEVFAGEVKANATFRVMAGKASDVHLRMAFTDVDALAELPEDAPKGRLFFEAATHRPYEAQGYYVPIDDVPAILRWAGVPEAVPLPAPGAAPAKPKPSSKSSSKPKPSSKPAPNRRRTGEPAPRRFARPGSRAPARVGDPHDDAPPPGDSDAPPPEDEWVPPADVEDEWVPPWARQAWGKW